MSVPFMTLDTLNITNKRVLIREDFNVPIRDGSIENDLRIQAALPGIKQALAANAQVMLMSHLGRPTAGEWDVQYSLYPIARHLQQLLNCPVKFISNWFEEAPSKQDNLVLFENVRFLPGETDNSPQLAQKMAALCDVFVMDAFGSAHRAHASTVGVAEFAPIAVGGPLLTHEVLALNKIMLTPERPLVAVIGGAKVSTKLSVLTALITQMNTLIIGGAMANTVLAAQGIEVGSSLVEPDQIAFAQKLLIMAKQYNCQILLPVDAIVADATAKDLSSINNNDRILDIGPQTIKLFQDNIKHAKTILWNGPLGMFEDPKFANGTREIAQAIAESSAFSVAGGGDTLSAIDQFGLTKQISYISTGGGAFLEYIEGKQLPGIATLIQKSKNRVTTN